MTSETEPKTEAPKKTVKKPRPPAAKKTAKKTVKTAAKKTPKVAVTHVGDKPVPKRGRPAGKKTAGKRRKKSAKQFAYMLLTPGKDGAEATASAINGPFGTDRDALDDAGIMAEGDTTIVLFREAKRGKVQKSTKFVATR